MPTVAKTFVIQGVDLPLKIDDSDVPFLEHATASINQAVRNVNNGQDLSLAATKQLRLFLYAILQLIYSLEIKKTEASPELEKQLENLLHFCNETLNQSKS